MSDRVFSRRYFFYESLLAGAVPAGEPDPLRPNPRAKRCTLISNDAATPVARLRRRVGGAMHHRRQLYRMGDFRRRTRALHGLPHLPARRPQPPDHTRAHRGPRRPTILPPLLAHGSLTR